MAISNVCSIPDCGKEHLARGWCRLHYQRWKKTGSPLGGGTVRGEPLRYFRDVVLAYEGDECLIWPYARSRGYGKLWHNEMVAFVHRLVCEEEYGAAPSPIHEAAHSCGKGEAGCCTKRHLSWKTPIQNQADKIVHGTTNRGERCGMSKLTEPEVREIIDLKGVMLQREIAAKFGITQGTVSVLQSRKSWPHLRC